MASEGKVLEEADESDAHMSTLDSLEVDAELYGAPNTSDSSSVTSVFESLCSPVPLRVSAEVKTTHEPTLWFKEGKEKWVCL